MLSRVLTILFTSSLIYGQTSTAPSAGDGTSGDPYQIATLNNLYWVTQNSGQWAKYFIQTADINASSTSSWDADSGFSPIGNSTDGFTGSYNGQNYTIDGVTIDRPNINQVGVFGRLQTGTIQNLGVTNVDITGNMFVGGLVGFNLENSTISNCHSTGSVSGYHSVGGLVGYNMTSPSVTNSYSTASVSGTTNYVGGLVGFSHTGATVSNCYSTGSANGNVQIGGLVGTNTGATISNCYSTASVTGSGQKGGLVGYNDDSSITNSYSTGSVSGSGVTIGGLVGDYNSSTVTDCFWDTQTSGQSSSGGGTGKTTTEMKTLATFTDENTNGLTTAWDFETNPNDDDANNNYWDIDGSGSINNGYPFLAWQNGGDVSLPVELSFFGASVDRDDCVTLEWITESEIENLGFILERREQEADWLRIASYITHPELKGQGSVTYRTDYSFKDNTVESGKVYDYRLADVSYAGNVEYHTITVLGVVIESLPSVFAIYQNYPNPFNPKTVICYDLPEQNHINITIYDLLGRQVKTLVNQTQNAGKKSIQWDATDNTGKPVSAGVYIYQIRVFDPEAIGAGKYVQTRKMILLK